MFSGALLEAQEHVKQRKVKVLPVPAFGYTPETGTYLGAVALFTIDAHQDTLTRSSNAKVEFNYTWRKQVIAEVQWNYFTRQEKWFTQGLIHTSKYPDNYFGIGSETLDADLLSYESLRTKMDINLLKKVGKQLFTGLGLRYFNYSGIQSDSSLSAFPELVPSSNFGISAQFLADQRDQLLTPTTGQYLKFISEFNTSQANYLRLSIDARKYVHWGKKFPQVLSTRFYSNHVLGNAPFYDLSLLGGDLFVRGYFFGRFRDAHLSTLQTELRTDLFWRIGLSVFGGYSAIYGSTTPLSSSHFKPNGGLGLRFMVDKNEKTNLRFDFAIGEGGQTGFYVSFGESF
jgi:outer membrane protein assembly factor BamA